MRQANVPARELATRAVRGSMFVAGSSYAGFLLSIAGTAGIARFVGPSEFGAYALAQAYAQLLVAAGAFAFTQAVLQSDRESKALADTALMMTLIVRVLLLAAAFPLAVVVRRLNGPAVASVFVQLMVVQVFESAKTGMGMPLQRRLEYGRFASVNLGCSVVAHSTGVAAAFLGWGVSALVLRDALLSTVAVAAFAVNARRWGLPTGRCLDREAAHEAWRFGVSVFFVRAIDQGLARIDRLVLGWLLPLEEVGCYQQARYISSLPSAAVAPGNLSVAVGMYSRVRHDRERLSKAFDTVQYFVARIVPPFAIVCAVCPDLIVVYLLGSKWTAAEAPLRAMAAYALLLPILDSYRSLMEATQNWGQLRRSSVVQAVVGTGTILALARLGAVGAGIGLVVGCAVAIVLLARASRRDVHSSPRRRYGPVGIATSVSIAAGIALRYVLGGGGPSRGATVVAAALCLVAYVALLLLTEAPELRRRITYIVDMLRNRAVAVSANVESSQSAGT